MNWDQVEGKWKQVKGSAKMQFAKLTDNDIDHIGGKRENLIGKLQERYGYAKEEAQRKADEWLQAQAGYATTASERDVHTAGQR
jgi:uncharacterized protein YjbJ (UPF0337 family)